MDNQTLTMVLHTIELALRQLSQGLARRVDVTLEDGTVVKVYLIGTLIRIDINGYTI